MSKNPKSITSARSFGFKATAIALAAATSLTFAAPAFAGSRHHGGGYGNGHGQGWGWSGERHAYNRGYNNGYHNGKDDNDDALAAVAVVGGVLLGAALLSQASQPAYSPPPQTYYAPPPAGYYDQTPIQATPASDVYQTQSGQYCREYQSSVRVGGQMQYGYGTACQQPDGSWRVVN